MAVVAAACASPLPPRKENITKKRERASKKMSEVAYRANLKK